MNSRLWQTTLGLFKYVRVNYVYWVASEESLIQYLTQYSNGSHCLQTKDLQEMCEWEASIQPLPWSKLRMCEQIIQHPSLWDKEAGATCHLGVDGLICAAVLWMMNEEARLWTLAKNWVTDPYKERLGLENPTNPLQAFI